MNGVKSIAFSADLGEMIFGSVAFESTLFASAVLRSAIVAGVIALSLVNITSAKEAQEIVKAGSLGGFVGDEKIFTGKVKVTKLFNDAPYRPFGGGLVEFERGARSAWHTHPAGQTLIVTKGVIITGTEQDEVQIAREGDTILCPPNLKHWHGAGDKQSGAHIALTGIKDGNNVNWLEKVSDEEYKATLKKAK
ncbi:hypothetical protein HMPREF2086_01213 [Helicobacter macacae MIT 99-5501]|uniref:Cupin type-2 domain-containing protein n=1 Tax=Helicobacter macacae MIT 99-5501 TaxID=1357400 RepID=V8C9J5_9HELI|nr:hypothetical protein HMPREF2086_01213 [Helicobacter macacae MIT 99-5501]